MSRVLRATFSEEEAWERSEHYAQPRCRRRHGQGVVWSYMTTDASGFDQSAIHLCACIRRKRGFVPRPGGSYDRG